MGADLMRFGNLTDVSARSSAGIATPEGDKFVPLARLMFDTRSLVRKHAEQSAITDGCWDILFSLYLNGELTISSLRKNLEVPLTTTLRWIDLLDDQGLISRREKPTDRRAVLVDLSDKGRITVEGLLTRLAA